MHLLTVSTGLLAASLFGAIGGPSLSTALLAPETRTTSITGRGCEPERALPAPGRDDEQVKRCPGLGGARVVVSSDGDGVGIGYEWSPRERSEEVLRHWGIGARIEWRGIPTARGFEPYAATVRVLFREGGSASEDRPVLAVMRVRRGEACVVGLVDVAANPDAYGIARRVADGRARTAACGRDAPRIEGTATARLSALVASL